MKRGEIMRLWHYQLLPYLPDVQFRGQLRELVAIMHDWRDKGETNHILINRVTNYSKQDLVSYFLIYRKEYQTRYSKDVSRKTLYEFLDFDQPKDIVRPFAYWHDNKYLRVCMANLYEKYHFGLGKSRLTDNEWQRLSDGYKSITGEKYQI